MYVGGNLWNQPLTLKTSFDSPILKEVYRLVNGDSMCAIELDDRQELDGLNGV